MIRSTCTRHTDQVKRSTQHTTENHHITIVRAAHYPRSKMKLCRRHLRLPCDLLIYYICSSSVPAFTSIRLNVRTTHSVFNIRCLSHVPIHRSNSPKHLKTEDGTGDGIEIDAGSGSFQMTVTDAVIVYTNTNPTAIDTRIRIVFCVDVMQRCCSVTFTCVRSRQSILIVFGGVLPCIG